MTDDSTDEDEVRDIVLLQNPNLNPVGHSNVLPTAIDMLTDRKRNDVPCREEINTQGLSCKKLHVN